MGIHVSIISLQLRNFYFNADPDQALQTNADPAQALQTNADPDRQQLKTTTR